MGYPAVNFQCFRYQHILGGCITEILISSEPREIIQCCVISNTTEYSNIPPKLLTSAGSKSWYLAEHQNCWQMDVHAPIHIRQKRIVIGFGPIRQNYPHSSQFFFGSSPFYSLHIRQVLVGDQPVAGWMFSSLLHGFIIQGGAPVMVLSFLLMQLASHLDHPQIFETSSQQAQNRQSGTPGNMSWKHVFDLFFGDGYNVENP